MSFSVPSFKVIMVTILRVLLTFNFQEYGGFTIRVDTILYTMCLRINKDDDKTKRDYFKQFVVM